MGITSDSFFLEYHLNVIVALECAVILKYSRGHT